MGRGAAGVAGGEQALDGGHPVVAPVVPLGGGVLRPGAPGAGGRGVRAHQVGLGEDELGGGLGRVDVLRRPDVRLGHRHVQEVLPGVGLDLGDLLGVVLDLHEHPLEGFVGPQVVRALALLDLVQHEMVPQRRRHRLGRAVRRPFLELVGPVLLGDLAEGVLELRLEEEEPHADGAVAVLEAGHHQAVLHLRHLGPGPDLHGVGRAGVPGGVPDTAEPLALGPGAIHAGGAAAAADDGLGLEDDDLVVPHREADHAGDAGGVVGVEEGVGHEDPLVEVAVADGRLGRFGHDRLVGLAVDHDLPAALTLVPAVLVLEDRAGPTPRTCGRRSRRGGPGRRPGPPGTGP